MYVEGTLHSPPGERAPPSPSADERSAARATLYDDILFCMSKQSKTCASLKFGELKKRNLTRKLLRNSHMIVTFWQTESWNWSNEFGVKSFGYMGSKNQGEE